MNTQSTTTSVIFLFIFAISHNLDAAEPAAPSLSLERTAGNVVVRFTGTLLSATNVGGPYQVVSGATNPHLAAISDSQRYWKVVTQGGPYNLSLALMLSGLTNYLAGALGENQSLLPRNPGLASQLQAKITMLQSPTLASDIVSGQFFSQGSVTLRNGKSITIAAIFPQDNMRADATESVRSIERAVPILESFLATDFPAPVIRIWYGFKLGNTGGFGIIYTEDRVSYESRTGPQRLLPFESILDHELSHTYFGNESLTQFLELYIYNMIHAKSTDVQSWITTRNWVAGSASNAGVHALLDIYQMIGPTAISGAYRNLYALRPPYGQQLNAQGQQVFVDQAPEEQKIQVAEKAAKIGF